MFLRCLLGLSLAVAVFSNTLDDLVPGKDFQAVTCDDAGVCIRTETVLVENTFWVEPESGLKYHEPRLFYVDTKDLYDHCAKEVAYKQLADSLDTCEDKMLEDVCEFKKKGWLKGDAKVNSEGMLNTFKKIAGGEAMVRTCLDLPDEDDEYTWEYDYYEYFADQWPLRRRRGAGRSSRNRRTPAIRRARRQAKGIANKAAAVGKKSGNGPPVAQNKGQNVGAGQRKGRGFVKKTNGAQAGNGGAGGKRPTKPEEGKVDGILAELGLSNLPAKDVLDTLICVKKGALDLMKKCGMEILSKAP